MIPDDPIEDLHIFETPDEAFQYIRYVGTLGDGEIDLGETALALGLLFLPGLNPDRYRSHIKKLKQNLKEEFDLRLKQDDKDALQVRLSALKKIIHETHNYHGDTDTYDDIQNANLIRVIDRKKGLPIAIGLIYIALARTMGWQIDGLNFPGHFLIRLEKDGERVIIDPFRDGKEMQAADLRQLLKSIAGQNAELSHNYYDAVKNRDMLIRLQNNLKKRLIETEEYASALIVVESMEALAPDEYRTLFDKGVLYAKLGHNTQAAAALENYIARTPSAKEKQHAKLLLQQIRSSPEKP